MDAGTWDDDKETKAKWQSQMDLYEQDMQRLQSLADDIDIKLGISLDDNSIKSILTRDIKDIDSAWLNSLSSEELNFVYDLENRGDLTFEQVKEEIDNLREESKDEISIKVTTSDTISNLEKLSDTFDKLSSIFSDVQDGGLFEYGSLVDPEFVNQFNDCKEEYQNFVNVVSASPSDISTCKTAFNDLITAWIYGQEPLQNITEESYDLTVAWMKQVGIENAVEMADYALAKSKEKAFIASHTLKEGTEAEIQALLDEANAAGFTESAMYSMAVAIATADDTTLTFEQQIEAIYDIASAAGLASEALNSLITAAPPDASSIDFGSWAEAAAKGSGALAEWQKAQQTKQKLTNVKTAFNKWLSQNKLEYKPTGNYTGGGGSGSGGGSSSDPYTAEIDKFESLSNAVDDVQDKIDELNKAYEYTNDINEQIALQNKLLGLYQEQKDALSALNNARDSEIQANVNKLRGKGFNIEYNPATDTLRIKNKELINKLAESEREELYELMTATEELNDANKDASKQWTELSYSILDVNKQLEELAKQRYENAVDDIETMIELLEGSESGLEDTIPYYKELMADAINEIARLVEKDFQGEKDRIKELMTQWMSYYDSRLEREIEIQELKLEDNDSVLSAINHLFDEEIKKIDEEIESLNKANEERKEALELQKAQADLDKARTQRTRRVLRKGVGFVYEADEDAIREAEETLADLRFEETISALESQKEALEKLQDKWAEIPDLFEQYQNELLAEQKFGANWESDILNDRISVYEDFKDDYFDIQKDIYELTEELNNKTNESYLQTMEIFKAMMNMYMDANNQLTQTATSTAKKWYVGKDGKAPSQANVGDIVYTKGGTYQITGKDENGKFTSKKLDNVSTPIADGMWGKEIKSGNEELVNTLDDTIRTSQDIINSAEKHTETILSSIIGEENLAKFIRDNTDLTEDEIYALFDNNDLTSENSWYTEDNTDSTDKNTAALKALINALANLELEEEILEEKMTLDNFDDSIMSKSDQAYVDALQAAWITAKEQGNVEMMEQLHALADATRLKYLDDDPTNDYNKIAEETAKLASGTYQVTSKTQIGGSGGGDSTATDKYLATIDEYREYANRVDANGNRYGSDEYLARLDTVEAIVTNGSGLTSTLYTDENGRQSTIIEANNKEELKMSADEIKAQGINTNALTDNTSEIKDSIDTSNNLNETIEDASDTIKSAAEKVADAYSDFVSSVNSSSGGSSSGSSGGNKNSSSGSDVTQSAEYKQYAYAKALAESQGNTEAAALAQANMDRLTKGTSVSNSAGTTKTSSSSSSSGGGGTTTIGSDKNSDGSSKTSVGSYTTGNITITRYSDGSVKTEIKKKAKGGLNLDEDIYNVDEKGRELIIEPDQGRYVRLSAGGSVIPADVTKNLWDFGQNPAGNIKDTVLKMLGSISTNKSSTIVQNSYHIDSIALPNVQDTNGFIRDLQNLPNLAKQYMAKK